MRATKRIIGLLIILAVTISISAMTFSVNGSFNPSIDSSDSRISSNRIENDSDFIKWIELNVSSEILEKTLKTSLNLRQTDTQLDFFEALAYITLKNSNSFSVKRDARALDELVNKVKNGETIAAMYGENKYFKYYLESYKAIFGGIVGEYASNNSNEKAYGISGFFPLASGFWFNHYDDFGNSRSFGFKRRHLGHDLQGAVGSPIIAVEGGTVAELGWNRYGGWRIGIRSKDTKRYYYYAHLRKDKPYPINLKLGDSVLAGQVIGFLGNTGYSNKENKNMTSCKPHLHFGLQIIFDKSQEKGNKEIWVDVYQLCRFLVKERAKVVKNEETKEYISKTLKMPLQA